MDDPLGSFPYSNNNNNSQYNSYLHRVWGDSDVDGFTPTNIAVCRETAFKRPTEKNFGN